MIVEENRWCDWGREWACVDILVFSTFVPLFPANEKHDKHISFFLVCSSSFLVSTLTYIPSYSYFSHLYERSLKLFGCTRWRCCYRRFSTCFSFHSYTSMKERMNDDDNNTTQKEIEKIERERETEEKTKEKIIRLRFSASLIAINRHLSYCFSFQNTIIIFPFLFNVISFFSFSDFFSYEKKNSIKI